MKSDKAEKVGLRTNGDVNLEKVEYCAPKLSRFGRFGEFTLALSPRGARQDGSFNCKIEGSNDPVACFS